MNQITRFHNFLIFTLIFMNFAILAQDNSQSSPIPNLGSDTFICTSIPTVVNGQEYDKTLKCETKDAICYVMEGFAMSCVPKIIIQPESNPTK